MVDDNSTSPHPKKMGRPKGKLNKRTLARIAEVNKIVEAGLTPLAVMTENMEFWHHQALEIGERFKSMVVDVENSDSVALAIKLMEKFFEARKMSQVCAVDAAPYIHPKLQAVTVKQEGSAKVVVVGGLPDISQMTKEPEPAE